MYLIGKFYSYGVTLEEPEMPPLTDLPKHYSKCLPQLYSSFVGRDKEKAQLIQYLQFNNSKSRIVGIFGGPGFGKSTLAIHACHILSKQNITIQYYDLSEVSHVPYLLHRILSGFSSETQHTGMVEDVKRWSEMHMASNQTILLFDGCDNLLSGSQQMNELQETILNLIKHTKFIKVLFTSRYDEVSFIDGFKVIRLSELDPQHAITLLKEVNSKLSDNEAGKIAELVGNVPLALQVVRALLETKSLLAKDVISKLSNNTIRVLSDQSLPKDQRISNSLQLSYKHLDEFTQRCGRYLARFPGSFSRDAAIGVISYMINESYWYVEVFYEFNIFLHLIPKPSHCLETLLGHSLIRQHSTSDMQRFSFHKLVKDFFLQVEDFESSKDDKIFKKGFLDYFGEYWNSFHSRAASAEYTTELLAAVDLERHNFELMEEILPEFGHMHNVAYVNTYLNLAEAYSSQITFIPERSYFQDSFNYEEKFEISKVLMIIDFHSKVAISEVGVQRYMELYISLLIKKAQFHKYFDNVETPLEVLKFRRHWLLQLNDKYGIEYNLTAPLLNYYEQMWNLGVEYEDIDSVIEAIRVWTKYKLPVEKYSQMVGYQRKGLSYFGAKEYANAIKCFKKHLQSCDSAIDYMYTQVLLYYSYQYSGDKKGTLQLIQGLDSEKSRNRVRKCSKSIASYLSSCSLNYIKITKIIIISLFYGNVREGSLEHQSLSISLKMHMLLHSFKPEIELLYLFMYDPRDEIIENVVCINDRYYYTSRNKSSFQYYYHDGIKVNVKHRTYV